MHAATDTPTTPHPIGPMPPLPAPRGDALPVVPVTVEQAAATFRCQAYACTLRGEDCAKRHQRARATSNATLQGSMHACMACDAGAARAKLLATAHRTDSMDGRRPYVPPNALGASKATRKRQAEQAAKNPPCEGCGRDRPAQIRRRTSDPRRPWCADCVGRATRRLRHLVVKPSAAAVVLVLRGASTDAAVEQALADGCKPAKASKKKTPKREARPGPAHAAGAAAVPDRPSPPPRGAEPCKACGSPRRHTRRPIGHPLRPYCYACVQVALSRVRHLAPHITAQSPAALAFLIENGDVDAALALAAADGANARPRQPRGRPSSSATALPLSFEPPVQADHAFSLPAGQVAGERAGDVADGSTGGHVSHPAGEPGAACDRVSALSSSRSPSSPELAAPSAESPRVQPALPFADDPMPTPADLDPPGRARLGAHAGDVAGGGTAKGPALPGTAKAALLLRGMRADHGDLLAQVERLQAAVQELRVENERLAEQARHLTAALALAHRVGAHHG